MTLAPESPPNEVIDGKKATRKAQVRTEGIQKSRARDARAQARDTALGALGEESHEPQTGDRDRAQRGASCRRQSPPQAQERPEEIVRNLSLVRSVSTMKAAPPSRLDLDGCGAYHAGDPKAPPLTH